MNNVLAIGWSTNELTDVIAQCSHTDICITPQNGADKISSSISLEFCLILINGSEHIEIHQKIVTLLYNCGVETVVFTDERHTSEDIDNIIGPYIFHMAPLTLGKIQQCLKNRTYRNKRRLYEQSSLGDFKQFLKLFQKSVSHEFNTPISVIKAAVHILSNYRDRLSEEELIEQINFVSDANDRLEHLVGDIRFDMDLTNKATKPNIGELDIIQAVEIATNSLHEKNRIIQLVNTKPIHALADPHLLSQAISRVAQNGLENSEGEVKISINESGLWIRIDISDTGNGIDKEFSERIFEPFTRYGNEDGKQGIGLGLPIAQKCMNAMKGRIDFISELGQGTTFSLHLPASNVEN